MLAVADSERGRANNPTSPICVMEFYCIRQSRPPLFPLEMSTSEWYHSTWSSLRPVFDLPRNGDLANRNNFHGICSRRRGKSNGREEGSCDFKPLARAHTATAAAVAADGDNAREAKMRKNGEGEEEGRRN